RLCRRAEVPNASPARPVLAAKRREEQVVVLAVVDGDANAVVVDTNDAAPREQPVRELVRLVDRDEEEAAARRQPRVSAPAPRGRASGRGASAPVGLFGRQQKVSTGSSSPMRAPASSAATR